MMKPIKYAAAVLSFVAATCAVSCSDDPQVMPDVESDGLTTLTIAVPAEIQSRSTLDDGTQATELHYAVYRRNGSTVNTEPIIVSGEGDYAVGTFPAGSMSTTVTLRLMPRDQYTAVFWAQSHFDAENIFQLPFVFFFRDSEEYEVPAGTLWVNYDQMIRNSGKCDAFYARADISGGSAASVTLTRPFAQVNLGATDYDHPIVDAANKDLKAYLGIDGIPDMLNMFTGETSGYSRYYFYTAEHAIPAMDEEFPGHPECKWLVSQYALAPKEGQLVECNYTLYNGNNSIAWKNRIQNIPVKANARTNLIGDLYLQSADIQVEIFPYMGAPYESEITAEEPVADANGNLTVSSAEQLKGLVDGVSAGNSYEGKTITINADIDLTGKKLPTNTRYTSFKGKIVGGGHAISGITEPLFANFAGQLENITLNAENANGSAFADKLGMSETTSFTDVTVNGSIYSATGNAAGLVANASSRDFTLSGCVNNATIVGKEAAGLVAGRSGRFAVSDCRNTGSIEALNGSAGGLLTTAIDGRDAANNTSGLYSSITNCVNEGSVTGSGLVGGIAATFGGDCLKEITNCSNSGALKSIVKSPGSYYCVGGIVGQTPACHYSTAYKMSELTNTGAITIEVNKTPTSRFSIGGIIGFYDTAEWATTATFDKFTNDAPITITGNLAGEQFEGHTAGLVCDMYLMAAGQSYTVTFKNCTIGDKTVISSENPGVTVTPYAGTAKPDLRGSWQDQTVAFDNVTNNTDYELNPPVMDLSNN